MIMRRDATGEKTWPLKRISGIAACMAGGMTTLLQDGAAKVLAGVTTIEEVFRVAQAQ